MFYLNLGFIVHWTLVLLILSIFSFLWIWHSFSSNFLSKIALHVFSELYMQSFSVIDLYRITYAIIFQPHMQSNVLIQSNSLIPPAIAAQKIF